jgi:hypothetical protein
MPSAKQPIIKFAMHARFDGQSAQLRRTLYKQRCEPRFLPWSSTQRDVVSSKSEALVNMLGGITLASSAAGEAALQSYS